VIEFIVREQQGIDAVYAHLLDVDPKKTYSVMIKEYKPDRSKAQNALSHVWYSQISRQYYKTHGTLWSPNVWKEYLKKMILGEEVIDGPGGPMIRTKRTRDLKVPEMTDYMEQVTIYCATEFEIILRGLKE
jgi:hypothetical protein